MKDKVELKKYFQQKHTWFDLFERANGQLSTFVDFPFILATNFKTNLKIVYSQVQLSCMPFTEVYLFFRIANLGCVDLNPLGATVGNAVLIDTQVCTELCIRLQSNDVHVLFRAGICCTASIGATTHKPRGLMKSWSMERNSHPQCLSSVHSHHAGQHIRGLYRPISTRVSGQIGIISVKKFEQDHSSITGCKIYVEMLRSFRDQNLSNCSTSGLNRKSRSNGVILCVAFFEL